MSGEMRFLQRFGDELKPPTDQPPADLRRRVLSGALPAGSPGPVKARFGAPVRMGRLVTALAAVAVALVGVVVAADSRRPEPTPRVAQAQSPGRVLELAAQKVALTQKPIARPDQFVHTESLVVRQETSAGGWMSRENPVLLVRRWQSVDGSRDSFVQERPVGSPDWYRIWILGCRHGQSSACTGRLDALPTDSDSMYQFLYRPAAADAHAWQPFAGSADDLALERVTQVLSSGQASPAVQEAVFAALQRIPRVSMRDSAVDVAGRTGVGLVYTGLGGQTELVFDADTYQYLGMNRQLGPRYRQLWQHERVVIREAIQRVAVVDRVGDLD